MFLIDMFNRKTTMPTAETALPGRNDPIPTAVSHHVSGRPLWGSYPSGFRIIHLGMGNFWFAEKAFWTVPGVWITACGYQGGFTPNPTYQETITGLTGHVHVVRVVYAPAVLSLKDILKRFFEGHDPTQGMRQGNDIGTAYRSFIHVEDDDDRAVALAMRDAYQQALTAAGRNAKVATDVLSAARFYPAEDYHQQYLAKNPGAPGGLRGLGIACPID
ncbi:peptide-methionine (S)-S-oxide reductase MsrA [Rhizobium sp. RU36D]|uniref:peptide-methionine (S)-S-oxide reductase MsrA n=1 Tax=Rhizobium sp. RU36D TaxID=1907415 RepID=UPI0009D8E369|nr:peptide-methionine (S)-S-oxide reductase MsrA [Rhizobium sp. RU36D]SMD09993.1 peptide-methionine (S)-S-oxide reductase [Rhizobium sp. RU36D]